MDAIIEKSKPLLQQAVALDKDGCRSEAVSRYIEGIGILMQALSCSDASSDKRESLKVTIGKYMTRAECLKSSVKVKVDFVEQLQIKAGTTGYGYDRLFARCLDDFLIEVHVRDAYIRVHHQIQNFIRFCELCVLSAKNLKRIKLITHRDINNEQPLLELERSFEAKGLNLELQFDQNLHDREIRFNNGWIVKIGRGLDYFRYPGRYALGTCDLNLRACLETTVDIFRFK